MNWFWNALWWVVKPHDHVEDEPPPVPEQNSKGAGAEPLERPGARRLGKSLPPDWTGLDDNGF
jgi:hypothetical protein